jgi:hypothetical protein
MDKEEAYKKIVKITYEVHIQNSGKCLDMFKNEGFNKIKEM